MILGFVNGFSWTNGFIGGLEILESAMRQGVQTSDCHLGMSNNTHVTSSQ